MQQDCQVLVDTNKKGKNRDWKRRKKLSEYVALAYEDIAPERGKKIQNCANWLKFTVTTVGGLRLHDARFCRERLCPICQWRRTLKVSWQMYSITNYLKENGKDYQYVLLTLTIPNVEADSLTDALDEMGQAWKRFIKYPEFTKSVKGWYKGIEVTRNRTTGTFHPHYHCLLCVNKSYFSGTTYVSRERWLDRWRQATRQQNITEVDVRKVKGDLNKACAEIAKYACKWDDKGKSCIIIYDDWNLTVDTLRVLDSALGGRRLMALGGIFREVHRKLHLDDLEDGDLTGADGEAQEEQLEERLFVWYTGYSEYYTE